MEENGSDSQIFFEFWTNVFSNLDKYNEQEVALDIIILGQDAVSCRWWEKWYVGKIHFESWTNIFCYLDKSNS